MTTHEDEDRHTMYDPTRDDMEEQFGDWMLEQQQKEEDEEKDCMPEWLE